MEARIHREGGRRLQSSGARNQRGRPKGHAFLPALAFEFGDALERPSRARRRGRLVAPHVLGFGMRSFADVQKAFA